MKKAARALRAQSVMRVDIQNVRQLKSLKVGIVAGDALWSPAWFSIFSYSQERG